jgi:hypothetical protein
MSNTITIEFCAEDRARLDRLTAALERRLERRIAQQEETQPDPVQQKLAETLAKAETPAEAPKSTTEAPEASAPPVTQPEEETPTEEKSAPAETVKPTVTLAQIQQKVIQLAAGFGGSKKAAVREIINAHAKKVTDLPKDKWAEVWDKLTALESEAS